MLTLKIEPDQDVISPREDMDNFTTMYCSHRRYTLGDKQIGSEEELWQAKQDADWFLPLFLLDHSGITMNTTGFNDPWDSGQVGIITITKAQLEAIGLEPTEENAHKVMRQEVETYDTYLRGDVWCYDITNSATGEIVDSMCGMYGHGYAEEQGKEALKRLEAERLRMMPFELTVKILIPAFRGAADAEENARLLMDGLRERDAILDWTPVDKGWPPRKVRYGTYEKLGEK